MLSWDIQEIISLAGKPFFLCASTIKLLLRILISLLFKYQVSIVLILKNSIQALSFAQYESSILSKSPLCTGPCRYILTRAEQIQCRKAQRWCEAWGNGRTVQCAYDVLLICTLETCVVLQTNVTPTNST